MRLEKLAENNVDNLKYKKIYCCEKNTDYLSELQNRYGIINNIVAFLDDNKRNQGLFSYDNKEFDVLSFEEIKNVEWSDKSVIITSDYYKEMFDKLCQISIICDNIDVVYYFANKETEYEESYRIQYENHKLEDIILFRSGPHASSYVDGMDFSDNARALFEYMLKNKMNNKYVLTWLVKKPKEFTESNGKYYRYTRDYHNVRFVGYDWSVSDNILERDEYYRVLCLARYIFFTDAYGFARNSRKDQIRVQLWHGCGFKTRVNFARCEKRYEYTTVISELYSKIHQEIYGLREEQMLVTGYAKQDWLFSPIDDFNDRFSIPNSDKYIFWLPTFRMAKDGLNNLNEYEYSNQTGLPIIDNFEKLETLNELLSKNDIILIIKLHPFQDNTKISDIYLSNILLLDNDVLIENDININQLLGCSDALISDYSSVAVDYMLLDKPIAFTLDDLDEYSDSRGFVFDNIKEWLPGEELYSFGDFCSFVFDVSKETDSSKEKRRQLIKKMHKYYDDNSCKRIVKVLGI